MAHLKTLHGLSSTLLNQSAKILAALEAHPAFKAAHTILLYHSLSDEVDTHLFIQKWSKEKQILLPVVVGNELELRIYNHTEKFKIGAYGIKEPIGAAFTNYPTIDLAVVPGVAFDQKGRRLGRGKGYYDRLLPHLSAFKIGICFPFQIIEEVPTEPSDIYMDDIITLKESEKINER